eukprot:c12495_g1_i1 orf=97-507(+)
MASITCLLCLVAVSALFFAPLSQDIHQAQASLEPYVAGKEASNSQPISAAAPATTPTLSPPPLFPPPPTPPPPPLNCTSACGYRCSLNGRPKICIRACVTCCNRCKCVPPGTSGNHHVCGDCYNNQFTHGGRSKCP